MIIDNMTQYVKVTKRNKKLKLTKKYFRYLVSSFYPKNFAYVNYKTTIYKRAFSKIRARRFYSFLFRSRQMFQRLYGNIKLHEIKKFHNLSFKKKNRLYLSNYLTRLELRLLNILYKSFILPKLKLLRQLILHKFVYINNKPIKGYNNIIKPNDLVYINPRNTKLTKHLLFFDRLIKRFFRKKWNYIIRVNESWLKVDYKLYILLNIKFTKLKKLYIYMLQNTILSIFTIIKIYMQYYSFSKLSSIQYLVFFKIKYYINYAT